MDEAATDILQSACRAIFDGLDLSWSWEDRFEAALVTYETEGSEAIVGVLQSVFGASLSSSDLGAVSQEIQGLVDRAGGLQPGQRIFHSSEAREWMLFAAIWPWGNRKTFSLRIGCHSPGQSGEEQAELVAALKAAFSLP